MTAKTRAAALVTPNLLLLPFLDRAALFQAGSTHTEDEAWYILWVQQVK